ncbi:MAG: hypothetical protein RBS07_17215 [Lentimicrobium sp.]|jgi:hypothetical protein|nr:hypothetical protein [Lentimicrobium sp.]
MNKKLMKYCAHKKEMKKNFTAAHPSPPHSASVKAWSCGVDVQMGLKG